jgi:ubiquinone biosynthesis protein
MNIWTVARPVVEEYIRENIGPRALARDLLTTGRVLARFGPRLPQLAEAALLAQSNPPQPPRRNPWPERLGYAALGAGALAAVLALVQL